ncbi:predicted protein [Postia placenta Mad-698-R]|nr:predicted protein [Postia placenta Mad-698-R]
MRGQWQIVKSATIKALVSLSLESGSANADLCRVKYHKDQANGKDYSHTGVGFVFKMWQADGVAGMMDSEDVQVFKADGKEEYPENGRATVETQTLKDAGGVQLGLTKAMGQEVKTEVPRAAEAGLYTWGDKGRLCTLVRAQLVCAQHADAAPGAVDSDMSISGM